MMPQCTVAADAADATAAATATAAAAAAAETASSSLLDEVEAPGSMTLPASVAAEAARAASAALTALERERYFVTRAEALHCDDPEGLVCSVTFAASLEELECGSDDLDLPQLDSVDADELDELDERTDEEGELCTIPQWLCPLLFPGTAQQQKKTGRKEQEDNSEDDSDKEETAKAMAQRKQRKSGTRRQTPQQESKATQAQLAATKRRRGSKQEPVEDRGLKKNGEKRKRRETGLQRQATDNAFLSDVGGVVAVYDDTCGEVVYQNGIQMVRCMSCHRCKNRKELCFLCAKHVSHRVCCFWHHAMPHPGTPTLVLLDQPTHRCAAPA